MIGIKRRPRWACTFALNANQRPKDRLAILVLLTSSTENSVVVDIFRCRRCYRDGGLRNAATRRVIKTIVSLATTVVTEAYQVTNQPLTVYIGLTARFEYCHIIYRRGNGSWTSSHRRYYQEEC